MQRQKRFTEAFKNFKLFCYLFLISELNERCGKNGECYVADDPEAAECRNGVCKCKLEYTANTEQNRCIRPREKSKSFLHLSFLSFIESFPFNFRFFQKHEPFESNYPHVNSISSCDNWLSIEGRLLPMIRTKTSVKGFNLKQYEQNNRY